MKLKGQKSQCEICPVFDIYVYIKLKVLWDIRSKF